MSGETSALRPKLMSVAYRIVRTIEDAEDAVQDAFLRWQEADLVRSPEGFLVRTTTRRCIDHLRAVQRRRKHVNHGLNESIDARAESPGSVASDSLSNAFRVLLTRLTPDERSGFLLRIAFEFEYAQIAEALGKSEVCTRQIVSRAKAKLQQNTPRFHPPTDEADDLAERFRAACREGNVHLVERVLIPRKHLGPVTKSKRHPSLMAN